MRKITAAADMSKAVDLIAAGKPINYEGANGPADFDSDPNAKGRVTQRISHLRVENKKWIELGRYDCVKCPAVSASCPEICPLVP